MNPFQDFIDQIVSFIEGVIDAISIDGIFAQISMIINDFLALLFGAF